MSRNRRTNRFRIYFASGEERGPLNIEEVAELYEAGDLSNADLIEPEGGVPRPPSSLPALREFLDAASAAKEGEDEEDAVDGGDGGGDTDDGDFEERPVSSVEIIARSLPPEAPPEQTEESDDSFESFAIDLEGGETYDEPDEEDDTADPSGGFSVDDDELNDLFEQISTGTDVDVPDAANAPTKELDRPEGLDDAPSGIPTGDRSGLSASLGQSGAAGTNDVILDFSSDPRPLPELRDIVWRGSLYDALNLPRSAHPFEIPKAYVERTQQLEKRADLRASRVHAASAQDIRNVLFQAHEILSDPERRGAYDAKRSGRSYPPSGEFLELERIDPNDPSLSASGTFGTVSPATSTDDGARRARGSGPYRRATGTGPQRRVGGSGPQRAVRDTGSREAVPDPATSGSYASYGSGRDSDEARRSGAAVVASRETGQRSSRTLRMSGPLPPSRDEESDRDSETGSRAAVPGARPLTTQSDEHHFPRVGTITGEQPLISFDDTPKKKKSSKKRRSTTGKHRAQKGKRSGGYTGSGQIRGLGEHDWGDDENFPAAFLACASLFAVVFTVCWALVEIAGFGVGSNPTTGFGEFVSSPETYLDPREPMIYLRGGVLVAVGLLGILLTGGENRFGHLVSRETGWIAGGLALGAIMGIGAFLVQPIVLVEDLDNPLAASLPAIFVFVLAESVFFHGFVARSLLRTVPNWQVPVMLTCAFYGLFSYTYWEIMQYDTSMLIANGFLLQGFGVWLPLTLIYWQSRSIVPPILAHLMIYVVGYALNSTGV